MTVLERSIILSLPGLPCWFSSKESAWLRKIPWEGNGNPLQYSCLGNPMDREAWWAKVHGVAKSQTQLSNETIVSPKRPNPRKGTGESSSVYQLYPFRVSSVWRLVPILGDSDQPQPWGDIVNMPELLEHVSWKGSEDHFPHCIDTEMKAHREVNGLLWGHTAILKYMASLEPRTLFTDFRKVRSSEIAWQNHLTCIWGNQGGTGEENWLYECTFPDLNHKLWEQYLRICI